MSDVMKTVDPWFLNLMVLLLGGYFIYSIKNLLGGFKASINDLKVSFQESINELKKLVTNLYEHRNDHENRITVLETRCNFQHDGDDGDNKRITVGRRTSDKVKL